MRRRIQAHPQKGFKEGFRVVKGDGLDAGASHAPSLPGHGSTINKADGLVKLTKCLPFDIDVAAPSRELEWASLVCGVDPQGGCFEAISRI